MLINKYAVVNFQSPLLSLLIQRQSCYLKMLKLTVVEKVIDYNTVVGGTCSYTSLTFSTVLSQEDREMAMEEPQLATTQPQEDEVVTKDELTSYYPTIGKY